MRDGLLIKDRQGSSRDIQLDLIGLLDFYTNYKMQMFIKLLSELSGSSTDVVTMKNVQFKLLT